MAGRSEIDLRPLQPVLAIIGLAFQFADLHPLLQELDEGQEERPVEPVLVKIVRHPVRGGDDGHAPIEEHLEEPPDDHRIGDVGDLHLVEAEKAELPRDFLGDRPDRIVDPGLARGMQRRLHLLHEGVEMHPALGLDPDIVVKEVHQHRLAASDAAPEIEALHRLGRLAEYPVEKSLLPVARFFQLLADALQVRQHGALRRVLTEVALMRHPVVDFGQGLGHGSSIACRFERERPGMMPLRALSHRMV